MNYFLDPYPWKSICREQKRYWLFQGLQEPWRNIWGEAYGDKNCLLQLTAPGGPTCRLLILVSKAFGFWLLLNAAMTNWKWGQYSGGKCLLYCFAGAIVIPINSKYVTNIFQQTFYFCISSTSRRTAYSKFHFTFSSSFGFISVSQFLPVWSLPIFIFFFFNCYFLCLNYSLTYSESELHWILSGTRWGINKHRVPLVWNSNCS